MKAWVNHFSMNIGSALANLFFAIVPPQLTGHTAEDLEKLRDNSPLSSFLFGLKGEQTDPSEH